MSGLLEIEFGENSERVDNLISAFIELEKHNHGAPQTRKDVLRAAVAFMHSTLEEIVRNLFLERLPSGTIENLNKVPFLDHEASNRPKGILLGELAAHRGQFVENIIVKSIDAYVDTMNLNNTVQLCNYLEMVGLKGSSFDRSFPMLSEMMRRRHQIVHQMDRANSYDPQTLPVTDITLETVQAWRSALQDFYNDILLALDREPK